MYLCHLRQSTQAVLPFGAGTVQDMVKLFISISLRNVPCACLRPYSDVKVLQTALPHRDRESIGHLMNCVSAPIVTPTRAPLFPVMLESFQIHYHWSLKIGGYRDRSLCIPVLL